MISPLYGQLSPLRIPTNSRFISADSDVSAYILAVESADGQQLEEGVITAIETFVLGCKSDGIWSAIKASCLLAGARTLSGALVPLVGSNPTNFNFVAGDYNRETGIKGNGSTKYLNSNRSNTADSQNDQHMSVFYSEPEGLGKHSIGAGSGITGATHILRRSTGSLSFRNRNNNFNDTLIVASVPNTFCGMSRSSSSGYSYRYAGSSGSFSQVSQTPAAFNVEVFKLASWTTFSDARLSFYSIGESIDLALLDSRVSTLMTDLAAAIP